MGTNIDRYFHHLSIARCSLVDLLHGIFEKIKSRLAAKVGKLRDMLHRALLMQTEFRKKKASYSRISLSVWHFKFLLWASFMDLQNMKESPNFVMAPAK